MGKGCVRHRDPDHVAYAPSCLRHLHPRGDRRSPGGADRELGHASVSTSEIYTHVSQARRLEVERKREAYLAQQTEPALDRGGKSVSQEGNNNDGKVIDITALLKSRR